MSTISTEALKQLFFDARTHNGWLAKDVPDQLLREIYDLMKWAPTSANTNPARMIFVKSGPNKEKLLSALIEQNVAKTRAAPVTAIIASDQKFYDHVPKLFPHAPEFRELFSSNPALAETTALRNGTLQGGYFILAARALGLDCGPMSGFDNKKMDELFLSGTSWKSNFICNIGYGDRAKLFPRNPRLSFDEACRIV